MAIDPPLLRLVEAQLGLIARHQALQRVSRDRGDTLLRRGPFEAVERGVYRLIGAPRLGVQGALAATLRAGPGATLTGPAALGLYELDGFGLLQEQLPFEVLLPPRRSLSSVSFRSRRDPDPDRAVATWGEIRIAGPLDALIDSAIFVERIGYRRLRLAHDVLRWRGMLKPGRLRERVEGLGRHAPGGAILAELLDLDLQASTGDGERRLGSLLACFDPAPEPQVWVTPGRRVDWYFRSVRYAWEYQGSVDHGTLPGRQGDAERELQLRREGIRIGYVTDADLQDQVTFLATVAGALSARAFELGTDAPQLRAAA